MKVHHRHLDDRRDNVVVSDDLQYTFIGEDRFEIRQRIHCLHQLFIDVEKTLEVNERDQVRTIRYSYHVGFAGAAIGQSFGTTTPIAMPARVTWTSIIVIGMTLSPGRKLVPRSGSVGRDGRTSAR